ncbi:MAG: hypothetical protein KOO62_11705 [candidate division Zixibacteria bacterium]|nr:hypothetical protein [candidate division Zixibacteria bacterium]
MQFKKQRLERIARFARLRQSTKQTRQLSIEHAVFVDFSRLLQTFDTVSHPGGTD